MPDDSGSRPSVLFVDDEPHVLDSFRRILHKRFAVSTALGSLAGLDVVKDHTAFAVVISDLRMPDMDGVEFLSKVRELAPDSVRILLTGHADVDAAIAAVNDGAVFRFLAKPCSLEVLVRALTDAVRQHRLLLTERELLRGTLRGAITVLTEMLALTNPEAFGRSERIKPLMLRLARHLGRKDVWTLELAAMLSQIGCVTLTSDMLRKRLHGHTLTPEEQQLYAMHPNVGHDLLRHIPRMREVARSIQLQDAPLSDAGDTPFGARALKVLLEYDSLIMTGRLPGEAILEMRATEGIYDSAILSGLEAVLFDSDEGDTRDVFLEALKPGMVVGSTIETRDGTLLATQGQQLSTASIARIRNFAKAYGLDEPLHMHIPASLRTEQADPPDHTEPEIP